MAEPTTTPETESWRDRAARIARGAVDGTAGLFGYTPNDVDRGIAGGAGSVYRFSKDNLPESVTRFLEQQGMEKGRSFMGDDTFDSLLFALQPDAGIDAKAKALEDDPNFGPAYKKAYDKAAERIEQTLNSQDPKTREMAEAALQANGMSWEQLTDKMKDNAAKKVAVSIVSSVQESIETDEAVLMPKVIDNIWKEKLQDTNSWSYFFENNFFGKLLTGLANMLGLGEWVKKFALYLDFDSSEERLRAYGTEQGKLMAQREAAEKVDSITDKAARKLLDLGMPPALVGESMVDVDITLRKEGTPGLTVSDAEREALKTKYAARATALATEMGIHIAGAPAATPPAPSPAQPGTAQDAARQAAGAAGAAGALPPVSPLEDTGRTSQTPAPAPDSTSPVPRSFAPAAPKAGAPLDLAKVVAEAEANPEFYASPVFAEKMTGLLGTSDYDSMADDGKRMAFIRQSIPDATFLRDQSGKLIIQVDGKSYYDDKEGYGWRDANKSFGNIVGKGLDLFRDNYTPVTPWMDSTALPAFLQQENSAAGADVLNGLMRMGRADINDIRQKIDVDQLGAISKKLAESKPLEASETELLGKARLTEVDVATSLGYARPATLELSQVDLTKYGATWKDSLAIAWGFILSGDDASRRDIIKEQLPQAEFEDDGNGNTLVLLGNDKFWLNKPGMSAQDSLDFSGTAALFTPTGRAAGFVGGAAAAGRNILMRGAIKGTAQVGAAVGTAALAQRLADEVGDKTPEELGGLVFDGLGGMGNAALAKFGAGVINNTLGKVLQKTLLRQPLTAAEKSTLSEVGTTQQGVVEAFGKRVGAANDNLLEAAPVIPGATLTPSITPKIAAGVAGIGILGTSGSAAARED